MKRTLFSVLGLPILLAMLALPVAQTNADVVVFELTNDGVGQTGGASGTNGNFDFGTPTDTFTDSGLTASFQALVEGSTGDLNAAGSSFGVNAEGTGDETSQLDGDLGNESIEITFSGSDIVATLTSVEFSDFGDDDAGTIELGEESFDVASGVVETPFSSGLIGNTLTIAFTEGNGFSIDELVFHVKPSEVAVPEPSSGLALLAIAGLLVGRRRR